MNFEVIFDWKSIVAIGGVTVAVIFAIKLDPTSLKEVSIHAIDSYKEYSATRIGEC